MALNSIDKNMIKQARDENWKTCIYGLGYIGRRMSARLAGILHVNIDFYCDGNPQSVDSFQLSGAVGIYKEKLKKIKENVLVVLLVDYPYDDEIREELLDNPYLHTVRLRDIAAMDEVAAGFYGKDLYECYKKLKRFPDKRFETKHCETAGRKKTGGSVKIAVYTCITGGYDKLRQPDAVEQSCDYYVVSDAPDMSGGIWKYIDVDTIVPDSSMSVKDKNRYCKMHPHDIFPEYDYAIYLDGSIKIQRPIAHTVSQVGFTGMAIHRHKIQDCVYVDGIFAEWLGVVKKDEIIMELRRYMEEGLPKRFGMFECGMIVTDLKNQVGRRLCRQWFEEYQKGAKRDQFSLIYVLWKMRLSADDVGTLCPGKNILTNPDIAWDKKAHYI